MTKQWNCGISQSVDHYFIFLTLLMIILCFNLLKYTFLYDPYWLNPPHVKHAGNQYDEHLLFSIVVIFLWENAGYLDLNTNIWIEYCKMLLLHPPFNGSTSNKFMNTRHNSVSTFLDHRSHPCCGVHSNVPCYSLLGELFPSEQVLFWSIENWLS